MAGPKKSLGQHWLHDRDVLADIAERAKLQATDTVLEIGPGLGTLTSELLRRAGHVVAVEFDPALAHKLPGQFPGKNLQVVNQDILTFDLSMLPAGYKVVANVPYYITSKIIQLLLTATHKPAITVLLVQKEVARRLAAQPGDLSILAISAQVFADVSLGPVVPAALFTPPPQVDSQVVVLHTRPQSLLQNIDEKIFFRIVKAGFSAKRKKLRSSLASGLRLQKSQVEKLLADTGIDPNTRAEDVTIGQWRQLTDHTGSSHLL